MATKYKCTRLKIEKIPGSVSGGVIVTAEFLDPTVIPPPQYTVDITSDETHTQTTAGLEDIVDTYLTANFGDEMDWTL